MIVFIQTSKIDKKRAKLTLSYETNNDLMVEIFIFVSPCYVPATSLLQDSVYILFNGVVSAPCLRI